MQKTIRLNGQKYDFDNSKAIEWLKNKEKQKSEQKILEEQAKVKIQEVKKEKTRKKYTYHNKNGTDKRRQPISQYDLELNWIADFKSIADASRKLGINQKMIYAVVIHKRNQTHGFVFLRKGEKPKQFEKRNIYMRGEEVSNFIQKKEEELESKINELARISKINGFNEVMNIIRSDEIALLKSLENKDKFVPLENAIVGNQDVKAKVEYIEDLYSRLQEKCK